MAKAKFEKFPIGFWGGYPYDWPVSPEVEVARWKECGFTFTMSPPYDPALRDKGEFMKVLDLCADAGIKLIICDARASWHRLTADPEHYRENFEAAYREFGRHPATAGFFIGDEPRGDQILDCIKAYRIQLEVAPELMPYLNFLPYWPGMEKDMLMGKEFPVWVKDFIDQAGCKIISYDCYWQMNPEEEGTERFFQNLNKFTQAAKLSGVPLICILLSVGHFRYRVVSEDDLRWQFNAAVATGCDVILWFKYYTPIRNNNYRTAPIDEFGEKTEVFDMMKRVHKKFNRDWAGIVNASEHQETFCFQKSYGGFPMFSPTASENIKRNKIRDARGANNVPGMLSFFKGPNGEDYVMIFNNSPFQSDLFMMTIDPGVKNIWRCFDGEERDFVKQHHDARYARTDYDVKAGVWLAPGQIEIFRFEY